jgi:hypothetical protein
VSPTDKNIDPSRATAKVDFFGEKKKTVIEMAENINE